MRTQELSVRFIHVTLAKKTSLARKATGNHLINYTSLEKAQSPVSGFCYARNRICNAVINVCPVLVLSELLPSECSFTDLGRVDS